MSLPWCPLALCQTVWGIVHINKNKIIKTSDYKVQIEGTFSGISMRKYVTYEQVLDWEISN